ncbi:hypothetical protein ONZ45_g17242 [Pleurotus djamor]|nr:hypothetical protein ONZ45_g17242 [Pleurotus djamor]
MSRGPKTSQPQAQSGKRSGGKKWTTPEERVWLEKRLKVYLSIRKAANPKDPEGLKRDLADFWNETQKEFIHAFRVGVTLDTDALDLLNRRLKQWFPNNKKSKEGVRLINFSKGKKRRLASRHAYSALYYKTKISPVVKARWLKEKTYDKNKGAPLWLKNQVTNEMWAKETKKVKDEVKAYVEEEYKRQMAEEEDDVGDDEDDEEEDAKERARRKLARRRQRSDFVSFLTSHSNATMFPSNINALNDTLVTVLQQLHEETGLYGFFALVGPEPKEGGNLSVFISDYGSHSYDKQKTVFSEHSELVDQIQTSLLEFGEKAFPSLVRAEASLPDTDHKRNYKLPGASTRSKTKNTIPSTSTSTPPPIRAAPSPPSTLNPKILKRVSTQKQPARPSPSDDAGTTRSPENDDTTADPNSSDIEVDVDMTEANSSDDEVDMTNPASSDNEYDNNDDPKSSDNECDDTSRDSQTPMVVVDEEEEEEFNAKDVEAELASVVSMLQPDSWITPCVAYLQSFGGHPLWNSLILAFIKFEDHLCEHSGIYPKQHRPFELSKWIQSGRKTNKRKPIDAGALRSLRCELYTWWFSMQPSSRNVGKLPPYPLTCLNLERPGEVPQAEWQTLMQGSQNTMYGVLACLAWWMEAVQGKKDVLERVDFDSLIKDVLWVITELLFTPLPPLPTPTPARSKQPRSRS